MKQSEIATRLDGNKITVMGRESQVNELADLIDLWNRDGMSQMVVNIRIMQSPEDIVSSRGIPWSAIPQRSDNRRRSPLNGETESPHEQSLSFCQSAVNYETAYEMVKSLQNNRSSNIIFPPTGTPLNGARVYAGTEPLHRQFVTGFTQGPGNKFRPVTEQFPGEVSIVYQAFHKQGIPQISLTGQLILNELTSVDQQAARTGNGQKIQLQIPEFQTTTLPFKAVINPKEALLLGLKDARKPTINYLLITPKLNEP